MLARWALIVVALVAIGWALGVGAVALVDGRTSARDAALAVLMGAITLLLYLMLRRRDR